MGNHLVGAAWTAVIGLVVLIVPTAGAVTFISRGDARAFVQVS